MDLAGDSVRRAGREGVKAGGERRGWRLGEGRDLDRGALGFAARGRERSGVRWSEELAVDP